MEKEIPVDDLIKYFRIGSDVEKGTIADVLKHVSSRIPELLEPYVEELIRYIDYRAPRVKWGVSEAIGNMSRKYPDRVEEAIPRLFVNAENESTVVRWCAAYALGEILKYNASVRNELVTKVGELAIKL